MRERCYRCFRPVSHCWCGAVPSISNRTDILILQHVRERLHPFNTARIVDRALQRCELIANHNRRFAELELPIQAGAGLLFPAEGAPLLRDLPPARRPAQLVIVDGTWHQAKTIIRDTPQLQPLPCYRLDQSSPGQYQIRREPNAESLSTLEATIAALRELDDHPDGLDEMMGLFQDMVRRQLQFPVSRGVKRKKRTSHPRYIPAALLGPASNIVVAYGEATPGRAVSTGGKPIPISWTARRLGTSEVWSRCLQNSAGLTPEELAHMDLTATDFAHAVSTAEFSREWQSFLRRNDVLVVYHQRTYHLLSHVGAEQPRCLVLKSIFGRWRCGFQSLEQLLAVEGLPLPVCEGQPRGHQRLQMAVSLVEHLRERFDAS